MMSHSCAVPHYCLIKRTIVKQNHYWWALNLDFSLPCKRKKRERKKSESDVCFFWSKSNGRLFVIRRKNLRDILCHCQVIHKRSGSNCIPCFCTLSRYCCIFVNFSTIFFTLACGWGKCQERVGEKKKENSKKGLKVVDLPSFHFLYF